MQKQTVRWIVAVYMLVFLAGTTWPGVTLFNVVAPQILGLPFNLAVLAAMICLALLLLAALYVSETRSQD